MGPRLLKRCCLFLLFFFCLLFLFLLLFSRHGTFNEEDMILQLMKENYGRHPDIAIDEVNWERYSLFLATVRESKEVEALQMTESETYIQNNLPQWNFDKSENPPDEKTTLADEEDLLSHIREGEKPPEIKLPTQNRFPILIWWTPFTGHSHRVRMCTHGRCLFTHSRALKDHPKSRAFFWYGTDLMFRDLPLPRKPTHDWALLHEESPKNNFPLVHEPAIKLFNHTATFRRESTYPISLQYLPSLKYLLSAPRYSLEEKKRFLRDEGLASVLYIQSDCGTPSDRDRYVEKLMEFIKVDSLGRCLHNKDLPQKYVDPLTMDEKGFHNIIAKYKFTLAFENAICPDYMTEKLWRPLNLGSLPVYRGSPSVQDWMPNSKTIIVADDYASPQLLAEYIKYLDTHDEEYERYFEFKKLKPDQVTNERLIRRLKQRSWGVDDPYAINFVEGFECHVCDRVYEELLTEARGEPPVSWMADQSHYGCPVPEASLPELEPDSMLDMWISEHSQQSYYVAVAAYNMVQSGANSSEALHQFIEEVYGNAKENRSDL